MSLDSELHNLGRYRIDRALNIAAQGEPDGVGGPLLLAVGSRETNMRNVTGGGAFVNGTFVVDGRDRGFYQISDVYHHDWLSEHPGCPSGTWAPDGHLASDPGHCPTFTDGTWKAISILRHNIEYAKRNIPEGQRLAFAVSAYNAGIAGAQRGYDEGDADKYTTGGDYSWDVLQRKSEITKLLKAKGIL